MTDPTPERRRRAPRALSPLEARDKAELRRRSLQVSTFCLHAMAWVLVVFYATDYLPPLAVRGTVGLRSPASAQYLDGYLALGLLCALLGASFGALYRRRIRASRYSWRWFVFPILVALLLIPAQGAEEWLSRGVELICLLLGIGAGIRLGPRLRPRRPPAGGPWAGG